MSRPRNSVRSGSSVPVFETLEDRTLLSALPVVSIDASVPAASENGTAGQFVVSRDVVTDAPLKVNLAFTGTARNGSDYTKLPAYAIIPANAASVTVTVSPIDDGKPEAAETALVAVKAAKTYTVAPLAASDTVTIADATYLAADFLPLTSGVRYYYRTVDTVGKSATVIEMDDQGADTRMWIRQYFNDEQSEQYSTLNNDTGDVLVVGKSDDGGDTTYTPGDMWFPESMTIGQSYSFSTSSSEGTETGTIAGTIKPVKVETVTTPAGTFKALKVVVAKHSSMSDWNDQDTTTYWLVRGMGIVKFTSKGSDNRGARWNATSNLTSYSLSSQWVSRAAMSTARNTFAGGVVDGKVYVFGGCDAKGYGIKSTEVFDPAQNKWSPLADNEANGDDGAQYLTGVGLNGKFYVFGAWGGTGPGGFYGDFNFAQVYDPQTDTWTALAPKPTAVSATPCAVYNGEIYMFGGSFSYEDNRGKERTTQYDVVEAYNPATNSWRLVTHMPKKLNQPSLAIVDDKAYVMGGFIGNKVCNATISYDFVANTWTTKGLAPMPHARTCNFVGGSAPVVGGKIYVIGGIAASSSVYWASNLVDIYDVASNTWSAGPSLPEPVARGYAAVIGSNLYVVGGDSFPLFESYALADVWRYALN